MKIAQSAVKKIPVGIVISSFDVIGTVMLKGENKLLLPEQILFFFIKHKRLPTDSNETENELWSRF